MQNRFIEMFHISHQTSEGGFRHNVKHQTPNTKQSTTVLYSIQRIVNEMHQMGVFAFVTAEVMRSIVSEKVAFMVAAAGTS